MCDFSLKHLRSRPAQVADKLIVKDFGTGTIGFADVSEAGVDGRDATAVCVLPGTEIAFDELIAQRNWGSWFSSDPHEYSVARFRQVDTNELHTHHDALELPNGKIIKLTTLKIGQRATVLQLPAEPKTEQEAKEQKRLETIV